MAGVASLGQQVALFSTTLTSRSSSSSIMAWEKTSTARQLSTWKVKGETNKPVKGLGGAGADWAVTWE